MSLNVVIVFDSTTISDSEFQMSTTMYRNKPLECPLTVNIGCLVFEAAIKVK